MSSVYYNVLAFILLFPWTLLAVIIVGQLRARWRRPGGSAGYPRARGYGRHAAAPSPRR